MILKMMRLVIVGCHVGKKFGNSTNYTMIIKHESQEIRKVSISYLRYNSCLNFECERMGNQTDKVFDVKSTIVTLTFGIKSSQGNILVCASYDKTQVMKCSKNLCVLLLQPRRINLS